MDFLLGKLNFCGYNPYNMFDTSESIFNDNGFSVFNYNPNYVINKPIQSCLPYFPRNNRQLYQYMLRQQMLYNMFLFNPLRSVNNNFNSTIFSYNDFNYIDRFCNFDRLNIIPLPNIENKITFNEPKKETPKVKNNPFSDVNEKDHRTARDYKVDFVDQGGLGDCFLLATITKHPEIIKDSKCLKWNNDGSAEVSLYEVVKNNENKWVSNGNRKTFHITNAELEKNEFELLKNNGEKEKIYFGQNQDITLKAIEIGFMKLYGYNYEKVMKGGNLAKALRMLYGEKENLFHCKENTYDREDLKKAAYASVSASSFNNQEDLTVSDINGKPIKIITNHAYTINGYNSFNDSVSISNPHKNDTNDTSDDIYLKFDDFKRLFAIQILNTGEEKGYYTPLIHINQPN